MSDLKFSANDAVATQRELRRCLGLSDEQLPVSAFIGMLSDEIEMMRAAGYPDLEIVAAVARVTGKQLTPHDIAEFYARPEARSRK